MTTLYILRGYPGSGKSTLAATLSEDGAAIVCRDDFRLALFGKYTGLSYREENNLTAFEQAGARELLRAGRDVIVDATNLRLKSARAWADLAVSCGADWRVIDVETGVEECVARNGERSAQGGRHVPEDVIRNFAARYPMPWPTVGVSRRGTPTAGSSPIRPVLPEDVYVLPPAVIVDLDGTLALREGPGARGPYDFSRVLEDTVNIPVRDAVRTHLHEGMHVIFLSGREVVCYRDTVEWLNDVAGIQTGNPLVHGPYMRRTKDSRPDYQVKLELFDAHVRGKFDVRIAYDDRNQVVELWRSLGLTCWQVNPGDF